MTELVQYNAMRQALMKAHSIDEVKDIRDRASALKAYAKQAHEGLENQNLMAEIKIRAERRAGEMLANTPRDTGGRPAKNSPLGGASLTEYQEACKQADIPKRTAEKWQAVASIPEPVFEAHLAETKASKKELTSIGVNRITSEIKRDDKAEKIAANNQPLADDLGPFNVIYADPPWRYEHSKTDSRKIENQYPTMTLDEICALPVAGISAPDSVLILWAPSPKLAEAAQVIEAWGFVYRTSFVWVKDKIGMGYYCRGQHEFLLVAARGALPVPKPANRFSSVINAKRGNHSEKPESVYGMLDAMYPEYKKIELFARNWRKNWSAWGNQVDTFVDTE